jgi:hypothetical protein
VADEKVVKHKTFDIKEGVNCVVCHGGYREWVIEHASPLTRDEFRTLSRAVKEQKKGMTDLWDPIKRVQLCASCHVGNLEQKKFITHEMYAAGHPPLPSFEPASFSNQMPRHWDYIREKPIAVQKLQGLSADEYEQTKLVLIGAALTLSRSMHTVAHDARRAAEAMGDDLKVLDLSHFDCYSCHHDLRSPSWRVLRSSPGKPGRVPMKQWPTELVRLALRHLAADEKAAAEQAMRDKLVATLQQAYVARPYGDPARMAKAAAALAKWADDLAERVNRSKVDRDAAVRMLKLAPGLYSGAEGRGPLLDYDSARQVAWACQAISAELLRKREDDPEVRKPFKALDEYLKLRFPRAPRLVEDDLQENLEQLYRYDPFRFRTLLGELKLPVP